MVWSETEKKYFAGLFDADGYLSFVYNNGYLSLRCGIELSESIDRNGKVIKYLSSKVGRMCTRDRDKNWSIQNRVQIQKRSEIELFLPHIIKHMVIKGKKFQYMLEVFREFKGTKITKEELLELREQANSLRGPLKPKKHPTWGWVAGYIDGDGWYLKRVRPKQVEQHVGVVSHIDHTEGLELLQKAFGGVLKDDRGHKRWIKNLGPRDKAFAKSFLKKMVQHSMMKTWKIEQLLSTYSQRLSVSTPKGGAIV